ncbi:MAG: methyltransferase family protein [Candidatus Thorarchaeota archaeon]|jgi:protein-S-isoprenylcysteine O-methyltransferase Ste14
MGKFEEMKEKYPRAMMVVQGLWIIVFATIISIILFAPLYIFDIDGQILVDVFTFPTDIIPQPYNLVGLLLIPIGMLLIIWANYTLLHIGKIGLRAREPMQRPSNLVLAGPYRFSRNPLYLGGLLALLGLVIVWSSLVTAILTILAFIIVRYVFIKREEVILEEEFGEEYQEFKNSVRRWI